MDDTVVMESKTGYQVAPALVVFQTPPFAGPKWNPPGCPMAPDTAERRPPRKGPTLRHARPERREDCAATEVAATVTAQSIRRVGARMAPNLSPKHDGRRETRRPRCVYDYG